MKQERFSFQKRLASFRYAFAGLGLFFRTEHNAWLHIIAALSAVLLGILLNISTTEWCLVVVCIALVISMEALNTAIEKLSDTVTVDVHPQIKKVKDISSSAVLISAIAAAIIGLIIFLPKIIALCK